jgi:hypothetical protein
MLAWQAAQTTRVLRRRLAMIPIHSGWFGCPAVRGLRACGSGAPAPSRLARRSHTVPPGADRSAGSASWTPPDPPAQYPSIPRAARPARPHHRAHTRDPPASWPGAWRTPTLAPPTDGTGASPAPATKHSDPRHQAHSTSRSVGRTLAGGRGASGAPSGQR